MSRQVSTDRLGSHVFSAEAMDRCNQLLEAARHIVVTSHRSPDGDAIGSSLALATYLWELGYSCAVVMPDDCPRFLHWMPGHDRVRNAQDHPDEVRSELERADLIFCLDYNALDRTGTLTALLEASTASKILIDHHPFPKDFADVSFSDVTASSTCELVYGWMEAQGSPMPSRPVAACLYVGMITDTGSFRYPAVTPQTLHIAARLMESGIQHASIQSLVYDTNPVERMRLVGFALGERLRVWPEYHAAIIALSQADLQRFQYRSGDTEGLVNQALAIEGVNLAVLMHEDATGKVKMSFRSRGKFSVQAIAHAHFSGGGHHNAAGGMVEGVPLAQVVERLEALLPKWAEDLTYELGW
ncbi:MAG: hypothetical protein RJA19_1176 [Bacteroidota bacterium]